MNSHPSRNIWQRSQLSVRQWLGLILLGHLLLTVVYSLVIPPWEAHDEWAHYRYAAFIAENRALPDPGQRLTTEFEFDEASQPPLYYMLAALPMLLVDTQDGYQPQINPHIRGDNAQAGVNVVLHDPESEAFPWQGTLLALHLGRWVSVVVSLLALVVTFKIIRTLSPEHPQVALAGTAMQAFAPQFVFISAVITNDVLVILLESLLLLLALRLLVLGPRPRLVLQLSLVTGLALLTKYLALAVMPLALVAFLWAVWRHRQESQVRAQTLRSLVVFAAGLLFTAGGLIWRNFQLTGTYIPRDPVSQRSVLTGLQDGGLEIHWALLPQALQRGFLTYWASFGWGNLSPDQWVYGVWLVIIAVALWGLGQWLRTSSGARARELFILPLLFVLAVVSLPLLREILHDSPHLRGRYMLATLPVAVWMLAQGWAHLAWRFKWWLRFVPVAWTAGLGVGLLFFLLMPAYAAPRRLKAPQPLAIPVNARFGDAAELLSVALWPDDEVQVGQGVALTLQWRVLARTATPYALDVQLLGAGGQQYGSLLAYPGHGNAATNVWQPGVFEESYWLEVQPQMPLPISGRVQIALFDAHAQPQLLPVYDAQGQRAGERVQVGALRIAPRQAIILPERPAVAQVGQVLLLQEVAMLPRQRYRAGESFPVAMDWQALGPGPADLTLSLQLLDADNGWVAGDDGDFSQRLLPQHWRAHDFLTTTRWFTLPPELPAGTYRLVLVAYRSGDLSRLPVQNLQHPSSAGDMWPLGDIVVQ